MAAINRRKNARLFLAKMAGITFKNLPSSFYSTRNISLSGMFVVGTFQQNRGNTCAVTLTERWLDREFVMTLAGIVTRQEQEGIAIQFTKMQLDTLSLLQTLLLYESGNPTSMGEEFVGDLSFAVSDQFADGIKRQTEF